MNVEDVQRIVGELDVLIADVTKLTTDA
jgi:hypothetical protein